ncbi:MAG TPA: 3D domain-containing protein [Pyrinomonadaceae bacterium]
MKSFFGGSVAIAAALVAVSLGFYAHPLSAETLLSQQSLTQQQEQKNKPAEVAQKQEQNKTLAAADHAAKAPLAETNRAPLTAPQTYVATAYSRKGRGASGMGVRSGTIAADTRVLPFGTRVRLDAGQYSGEYVVTDTGSAIKGNKIDVWIPSYREACRFGRRNVKLSVLSYGGRRRK